MGIINKQSKEFRIEPCYEKNDNILKKFITTYIDTGNAIITDGWPGYLFLNAPDSGYIRYSHIHNLGPFGFGFQSTSHIEGLWNHLKKKIKKIYHIIPNKNIMKFIREAEYKYINRTNNYDEKIKDFFDCIKLIKDLDDLQFEDFSNISGEDDSDESDESY